MLRSILLSSVLAFSYFTGCESQASADIAAEVYSFNGTLPGATIDFAGSCDSVDSFSQFLCPPAVQTLPLVFNIPQFNPSLGSLQSVELRLFLVMGGTATETNAPVSGCPSFSSECHNAAGGELTFGPVISFSTGGGPSYRVSQFFLGPGLLDTTEIRVDIPPEGGTGTEAFPSNNNSDTGVFQAVPFYFPGDPGFDAFVGTGHVSFNIYFGVGPRLLQRGILGHNPRSNAFFSRGHAGIRLYSFRPPRTFTSHSDGRNIRTPGELADEAEPRELIATPKRFDCRLFDARH
jgi:hypothetical protein